MSANNDGFGIYKQNIGFLEILVECDELEYTKKRKKKKEKEKEKEM